MHTVHPVALSIHTIALNVHNVSLSIHIVALNVHPVALSIHTFFRFRTLGVLAGVGRDMGVGVDVSGRAVGRGVCAFVRRRTYRQSGGDSNGDGSLGCHLHLRSPAVPQKVGDHICAPKEVLSADGRGVTRATERIYVLDLLANDVYHDKSKRV
eukprot:463114-Pyramimonas_sp.AAC.1